MLGLPDLDGATTMRLIRGVSSVPVIVVTACREATAVRLLDCGADDFVVKPFASAPGCTRSATCGWAWRAAAPTWAS